MIYIFLMLFGSSMFVYAGNTTFNNRSFYDINSSKITQRDINLLSEFDTLAYDLADNRLRSLNISKIYNYIKKHKAFIQDYSLSKLDFKMSAGRQDYDYLDDEETGGIRLRDRDFKRIGIYYEYPLLDFKTRKDIVNKKLEHNLKILGAIKLYAKTKDSLISNKRKLRFTRLLQIREKLQVKKGIKYLDQKIKTLEKILILQNTILDNTTTLHIYKNTLLNYVKVKHQKNLRKLL